MQNSKENGEEIRKIEQKVQDLQPKNFKQVFLKAGKQTFNVWLMIVTVYIPVSLLTILLKQAGVIDVIAPFFSPVMELMGLPGETALSLIAGSVNTLYAVIGTVAAFNLTARQLTILAVVSGICHNLILETAILKKLKIATVRIAFFRIIMAIFAGILMNMLLPKNISSTVMPVARKAVGFSWEKTIYSIGTICVQILLILSAVMLLYELVMFMKLSRKIKKVTKFMPNFVGISDNAFGPWAIGFFAGILYGAGILFQFEKDKKLSSKDGCLVTVFLVLAHAIVEDTMLFAVIGGNFLLIILPRIFIAFAITRILSFNDLYKKFLWIGLTENKK